MIQSAGAMNGAGSVTNWYSFIGNVNNSGTGTVTNGYGLYIQPFGGNITNKYGVYIADAVANNYFGGTLSIGTTTTQGYQLAVNGSAIFTRAVVKLFSNWPDNVFDKDYKLPSLNEVKKYIQANNHLPELPPADSVSQNGIDLGSNQTILVKKIEELTLYVIQQKEQLDRQQKEIEALKKQHQKETAHKNNGQH
jgi:hypothetical protein